MNIRRLVLGVAAWAVGVSGVQAREFAELKRTVPVPATEPIPVIDFIRPSLFDTPSLSPDGKYGATVVSTAEDRGAVVVFDAATNKVIGELGGSEKFNVHRCHWLTNDRLLIWSGSKIARLMGVLGVQVTPKGLRTNQIAQSAYLRLLAVPDGDPQHPLMMVTGGFMDSDKIHRAAVNVDAYSTVPKVQSEWEGTANPQFPYGVMAMITTAYPKPGYDVYGYLSDGTGRLSHAVVRRGGLSTLLRWTGKEWEPSQVDLDYLDIAGHGRHPDEVVAMNQKDYGRPRGLSFYDLRTGKWGDEVARDENYDLVDAYVKWDDDEKTILGIYYTRSEAATLWLDPNFKAVQAMVDKAFPGQLAIIADHDRDRQRFVLSVGSDRQPYMYYSLNLASKQLALIKSSRPWIDAKRMRPMQIITYKSRDGHAIEGFLTLPEGASKERPAPLVVYPHGGPWSRDEWGYDSTVQLLASRGYAVLQPNYRGSTGTQWQFSEPEMFEFRKMHEDVTDGVLALIKSGVIDPKRVAIMGGSFGGYLAVCGVAFERQLYRCAITLAGVFDWEQFIKTLSYNDDLGARSGWLRRHLGNPREERARFDEIAPLRHLAGVRSPVFVSHGRDDTVVPISESEALIAELKRQDVPYEKYFITDEGHGVGYLEHRIEYYQRILSFLDQNLK